MNTIIASTLAGMLVIGSSAAFAQQTPPPAEPQMPPPAVKPTTPHPTNPAESCASRFPMFSQLDIQHTGKITKQEAGRVPLLERNFKKADTNHDGKLSQSEYGAWVERQCSRGLPRS